MRDARFIVFFCLFLLLTCARAQAQLIVKPPAFALFVNEPSLMHFSYQRYLENQIRKAFSFEGTPVRFLLRKKE